MLEQAKANMNRGPEENAVFQDSQTEDPNISEAHKPTGGVHGFVMRHMGHQDVTPTRNKRMRSLPVIPIMLMILVGLHIIAAIFLSKTGSGAFSFNNPLSLGMIGLALVLAISKLKHILGIVRRKDKPVTLEIGHGEDSVQHK